jgi:DNA-binding CsgD family transcriptional regulator
LAPKATPPIAVNISPAKRKVTAEYALTADQRALVESASAFGLTQAEIAAQLKISADVEQAFPG